jgi:hypothetical protein
MLLLCAQAVLGCSALQSLQPTKTDEALIVTCCLHNLRAFRVRMCRRLVFQSVLRWYRRFQQRQKEEADARDQGLQYKLWDAARLQEQDDKRRLKNQEMAQRVALLQKVCDKTSTMTNTIHYSATFRENKRTVNPDSYHPCHDFLM